MSRFLDPRLSRLIPYTPGEQPRGQKLIKLNTNELPYPPSPKVIEAVSPEVISRLRLYSDTMATDLVAAICEHTGLKPENVVVGNGSDEILAFAFQAFCGTKPAVFPAISYGFYPVFADLYGIRTREVPLRPDFSIDPEDYMVPGENVIIANPNAPTGLALSPDQIERILLAHPNDVVLIDEAYVDFGAESAVSLIPKYQNLLVVQTFSKSRALAGGRVGFAMGSPELIGDLTTVRFSYNPYNLGSMPQVAAAAAMRDEAYFTQCVQTVIATRERCARALADMGCTLTDSRSNFLFVSLPGIPGGEAQARLREKGLLVRWFDKDTIRDYLRITVGSDAEMDELLSAVRTILKEGPR